MLVQFAEKNPGMARVMVGDALVFENERLQQRMNQFFDKVEASLKQCLRDARRRRHAHGRCSGAAAAQSPLLVGRLQRYVRSGFQRRAIRPTRCQPGFDAAQLSLRVVLLRE